MVNKYEKRLTEQLRKEANFSYEDIPKIDHYPLEISGKVFKILIKYVCDSQNHAAIELGWRKIAQINKQWLIKNFMKIVKESVDCSDEWEYRRLVELVVEMIPELKEEVLKLGMDSDNEEVLEVVEDFRIM